MDHQTDQSQLNLTNTNQLKPPKVEAIPIVDILIPYVIPPEVLVIQILNSHLGVIL